MKRIELTVVVTIVESGATLVRCLEALSAQTDAPAMEVIVPYDDSIAQVSRLAGRFPQFRFLALGALAPASDPSDHFTQHVLYDRRRAGGLRAAQGHLVAMVEDRGWPRPDWARTMVLLHETLPHAAIGGAVESAARCRLRWAAFFCDFGRYEQPAQGEAEYLTDVNICYKRPALEQVRHLWLERYQEATVNWALRRHGLRLLLSPQPRVVQERGPMRWWSALAERIHWGRTFGNVRAREASRLRSAARAVSAPLVPAVLLLRHLRKQQQVGRDWLQVGRVLPATFLLMTFWTVGEFIGTVETMLGASPGTATE